MFEIEVPNSFMPASIEFTQAFEAAVQDSLLVHLKVGPRALAVRETGGTRMDRAGLATRGSWIETEVWVPHPGPHTTQSPLTFPQRSSDERCYAQLLLHPSNLCNLLHGPFESQREALTPYTGPLWPTPRLDGPMWLRPPLFSEGWHEWRWATFREACAVGAHLDLSPGCWHSQWRIKSLVIEGALVRAREIARSSVMTMVQPRFPAGGLYNPGLQLDRATETLPCLVPALETPEPVPECPDPLKIQGGMIVLCNPMCEDRKAMIRRLMTCTYGVDRARELLRQALTAISQRYFSVPLVFELLPPPHEGFALVLPKGPSDAWMLAMIDDALDRGWGQRYPRYQIIYQRAVRIDDRFLYCVWVSPFHDRTRRPAWQLLRHSYIPEGIRWPSRWDYRRW